LPRSSLAEGTAKTIAFYQKNAALARV